MPLRGEAKKRWQALYNARRKRGQEDKPFVAVDSEGVSFGPRMPIGERGDLAQCQRTIFWGAGSIEQEPFFLDGAPYCKSSDIMDWLLELPEIFGPSIFVWFGSSYDATQLFVDLPYRKAWELQNSKSWYKRDDPSAKAKTGRFVFWRGYALCYVKQKRLKIARLKNPDKPRDEKGKLQFSASITLYDVFGFFQCSFLKAAKSIPGSMTDAEKQIIEEGKKSRGDFMLGDRAAMQRYTAAELIVLARMMTCLRDSLESIDIRLQHWQGAGSIASALLKRHNAKEHFFPVLSSGLELPQQWAHHAFFGGRIECLKQGRTSNPLYSYDVRSAYPYHMTLLPSMTGGHFRDVENPTLDMLRDASALSMFEIEFEVTTDANAMALNKIYGSNGPEFYPFPYRDHRGRITYPPRVHGIYMAEEVRAALLWIEYYQKFYRERARNSFELPVRFRMARALLFENPGAIKTFFWLENMYRERRQIVARNEAAGTYDLTEKCYKVGINSCYGKTAQSVGSADAPPSTACPWYAAAITAGTRAQLLRAAISRPPGAIIAFQTDGIVTEKPLAVNEGTELGQWEKETVAGTSLFVQPGIYHLGKKSKHRGIKADLLGTEDFEKWLNENAGDRWQTGSENASYPYRYYMTLGAAVASEERWKFAGYWIDGTRELQLNNLGFKRSAPFSDKDRRDRSRRLIDTIPKPAFYHDELCGEFPISAPHKPDWLDSEFGLSLETENLNEEIAFTNT